MSLEEDSPTGLDPPPERRRAPRRTADLQFTRGNRELETALLISKAISNHTILEDIIAATLDTALEAVHAEAGSVLLADPNSQQLVTYRSVGEKPIPPGFVRSWHDGIAGAVFQSSRHATIVDADKDAMLPSRVDKATGSLIRNMIILPLKRWQGEPIGVMEILNKHHGCLDDEDVAILTIISSIATPAIEKARLCEAMKLADVARMAGDLSHDIKNLLMPVLCGAEVLKEELDDLLTKLSHRDSVQSEKSRAVCHEVLDMVQEDVRRISDRVRELSDCVKGMSASPKFSPCRITDVVLNVFKTLELIARRKGITLKSEGLEALPALEADEQRLYNAFYNLVNNAIPEMSSGGAVTISGTAPATAEVLDILVSDTGRGMPPEIRDRLFTSRSVSRKPGGTGLGIKIVKDVVDIHKGHIDVESVVGNGTTFRLILPLKQATGNFIDQCNGSVTIA